MILNMVTVDNTNRRISLGDTTPTDIKFSISARSTEKGRSSMIIKSQLRILIIIYLTYSVFYMAFPSVIFMHFTMTGHYYHVIKSYEDHEEEAARNFLTIYVFTILFGARLGAHLIDFRKLCVPNWCIKHFMGPLLTMMRIYIVANFYISLWKTRDTYIERDVANITTRYWPPMIYKEILLHDVIFLSLMGFSHGLLSSRYMSKKPLYADVYLRYQDKAGM